MPLQPVSRQSLPDAVFDQLAADIVAGDLAPGDQLPSERRLAEALQVSRPAVREGLKRLAQSGLVDIRQGDATTVRDFRRSAGLDLLPRLFVRPDGTIDLGVARSIMEVRAAVGPTVARLAAIRARSAHLDRLRSLLDRMAATDDAVELQRLALDLWDTLVDAGNNVAFRLMFNALSAAYEPVLEALAEVMRAEVSNLQGYGHLVDAVAAGAAERAERAADAVLTPGTTSLLAVLDELGPDEPDHDDADPYEPTADELDPAGPRTENLA